MDGSPGRGAVVPRLVVAAGVLVAVGAAGVAAHYQPFGFDEGCYDGMPCARPEAAAVTAGSWWGLWSGATVVLVGLVLLGRSLAPSVPRPARRVLLAAGLAGAGGLVAALVADYAVLFAAFFAPHAGVVAVGLFGMLQARGVSAALHGPGLPDRRSFVVGLLAGAAATAACSVATLQALSISGAYPHLVLAAALNGAVLAAVVLIAETVTGPGPRRPLLITGAAVLGGITALVITVDGPERPASPVVAGPAPAPVVTPPPTPVPVPVAEPAPPVSVPASVACRSGDLAWSAGPVDGAIGLRYLAVVVHNDGRVPCRLDGVAQVRLDQGGRPLALTVRAGDLSAPDHVTTAAAVGIPPGGAARFALTWRTWGGLADAETPQTVTVALVPGGPERAVPLTGGPAPLDIADGGELYVSGWAPVAR